MTFEDIMQQITEGLPGSPKADIAYLNEQTEQYLDHPYAKEITRAIGRMIYERIPEDERKKALDDLLEQDIRPLEDGLNNARTLMEQGDLDSAQQALEALVEQLDARINDGLFQNDEVSEYYCFNEPFEEILYGYHNRPSRDLRRSAIPFAEVYTLYGSLLMERKEYRVANYVLSQAQRWNPSNAKIAFEYAESFKMMGDLDRFFELTKDTFKYAFHLDDVARCYRNLGYYFIEQEQWNNAKGCLLFSLQFDDQSPMAHSELAYIDQQSAGTAEAPSIDDLAALGETHGFPLGADDVVIGLAYHYGQEFMRQQNVEAAHYFLTIAYDLTEDDEVQAMLDTLEG